MVRKGAQSRRLHDRNREDRKGREVKWGKNKRREGER